MTNDAKPFVKPQSEHGTEPTNPSDGTGPIPSVNEVLMAQATALAEQAKTIGDQNATILELVDRLTGSEEEEDPRHGRDLAGNPVKVS